MSSDSIMFRQKLEECLKSMDISPKWADHKCVQAAYMVYETDGDLGDMKDTVHRVVNYEERYCHCLLQQGATLPLSSSAGAAGYDLYACAGVSMAPGERVVVSTGVHMEIPSGYFGKIEGRSGLAMLHGIITAGGIIDSDYRGEIRVILINTGGYNVCFNKGDRIAQLIIQPHWSGSLVESGKLSDTERGAKGFGSTGQ